MATLAVELAGVVTAEVTVWVVAIKERGRLLRAILPPKCPWPKLRGALQPPTLGGFAIATAGVATAGTASEDRVAIEDVVKEWRGPPRCRLNRARCP